MMVLSSRYRFSAGSPGPPPGVEMPGKVGLSTTMPCRMWPTGETMKLTLVGPAVGVIFTWMPLMSTFRFLVE